MYKQHYEKPAVSVLSLAPMQETLQTTSINMLMIEGADVTFETETTFDAYFGL